MANHPEILATTLGQPLAEAVCRLFAQEPVPVRIERYERREIEVFIERSVRNREVFLIAPCIDSTDISMAIHLSDAARRAHASSVNLIVPYFYCSREQPRHDRRTSNGVLIAVEQLELAHAAQVVFIDLHTDAPKIAMRKGIPDELHVSSVLIPRVAQALGHDEFIVMAPVEQTFKRARKYAQLLGKKDALQLSMLEGGNLALPPYVPHDVCAGKAVVIADSIIDSGRMMCRAATLAKEAGAKRVIGVAPHGVFSNGAFARIDKCKALEAVFVTDTLPSEVSGKLEATKVVTVPIAPLLHEVIRGISYGHSLSRFA